ncbi:uncharacterized protein CFP56_020146 [Quercus suber]|uniref:Zinc knuckle CX2CX4HX4C domain-containing protein n=1 Tax=Quercus suber TaxID=58331 RepID=A0AAW0KHX2_QUESU
MGNHLVLFSFFDSSDVARVMEGEPWSFDKHLVAIKPMERSEDITSLDFSRTCFWVQLHGPSIGRMSHNTALEICSVVGEVKHSASGEGERRGFNSLRVRVNVNNSQPLCRGRRLSLANGSESWVRFMYERLPNICYWCGRLTHSDRECSLWICSNGTLKEEDRQFGSWLRAMTPNPSRKMVVRVAGFEEEFLRNGHRGSEGDATIATESTGGDLGNIPAQSADPVRGTASAGVDSENPVLERACFQGTVGDTHSIPSNEYPVSGASNFEKGENDVTFQNQLANIDSELAKFDVGMGPRNLGVNGPSARIIDAPPLTNGPVLNHGLTKTSSQQSANVKNQIEFFDRVQQESSSADPKVNKLIVVGKPPTFKSLPPSWNPTPSTAPAQKTQHSTITEAMTPPAEK